MNLPEKIAKLRKERGISQEKLAELLNVSRQTVSRWETGAVAPDAQNIREISKLFGVTSDFLLNDDFETDDDLPQIKEAKNDKRILHLNLTVIAIILQAAFLNLALHPFYEADDSRKIPEIIIKCALVLAASIWMAYNLKYESNKKQRIKNALIELAYCSLQIQVFIIATLTEKSSIGSAALCLICLFYLLFICPKFMNRSTAAASGAKDSFSVSLCKNGLLGGLLYIKDDGLFYSTNKLTVSEKIRRLHMPYRSISKIEKASFHTVTVYLKNGESYRFLIFARKRFLENVKGKKNEEDQV